MLGIRDPDLDKIPLFEFIEPFQCFNSEMRMKSKKTVVNNPNTTITPALTRLLTSFRDRKVVYTRFMSHASTLDQPAFSKRSA